MKVSIGVSARGCGLVLVAAPTWRRTSKGTIMTKQSSTKARAISPKPDAEKVATPSKLDRLVTLLRQPGGAAIDELTAGTGWQNHSVRGALAGTLKKKGHAISSEVTDGVRRYRIAEAQA